MTEGPITLPNVAMTHAIDAYRDHLMQSEKRASTALRHAYYLRKNCVALHWMSTGDVPATAFHLIAEQWRKPTARLSQWALAAFVRWARDRYRINDAVLAQQVTRYDANREDDWDEADLHYVLGMMRGTDDEDGECPFPIIERCTSDRALQKASNLDRGKRLFLIVWLVSQLGIRRAEVMSLRVGDWKAFGMRLLIRQSATRLRIPREVVVDPSTAALLDRACSKRSPEEYLVHPKNATRWRGIYLSRQFLLYLQSIGMSGSLTMCHRMAVRTLIRRMVGDLDGAARMLGFSCTRYLLSYAQHPEKLVAERRRARALADEIGALFHVAVSDSAAAQPANPLPSLTSLQDIMSALRPAPPSGG